MKSLKNFVKNKQQILQEQKEADSFVYWVVLGIDFQLNGLNPLSAILTKWSITFKQLVGF